MSTDNNKTQEKLININGKFYKKKAKDSKNAASTDMQIDGEWYEVEEQVVPTPAEYHLYLFLDKAYDKTKKIDLFPLLEKEYGLDDAVDMIDRIRGLRTVSQAKDGQWVHEKIFPTFTWADVDNMNKRFERIFSASLVNNKQRESFESLSREIVVSPIVEFNKLLDTLSEFENFNFPSLK